MKNTKLKFAIITLFVLFTFSNKLFAQELLLDLNYSRQLNAHTYTWTEKANLNNTQLYNHGLQIGLTKNLYKNYYLKLGICTNSIDIDAEGVYQYMIMTALVTQYYVVQYRRKIVQLDILPAYRFDLLKGKNDNHMLMYSAGISIQGNKLNKSVFKTYGPDAIDDDPYKTQSITLNMAFKTGVNYRYAIKKLGLIVGVYYTYIPPYHVIPYEAQIDTHQLSGAVGFSYKIK